MSLQTLKKQARKEFGEKIDSLIDKTVQISEERIVEYLNQQKAKLDNCNNVDGRVQSECFKRNRRVEDWNEVVSRVISLITNKSDINDEKVMNN